MRPSLSSLYGCIILAMIILVAASWTLINNSDYLAIFQGASLLWQVPSGSAVQSLFEFFDSTAAYGAIVIIFASVCGLLIFLSLETITHSTQRLHESVEDVRFARGNYKKMAIEGVIVRFAVRIASFAAWLLYIMLWLGFVVPLCIALTQIGIATILTETGWLLLLASLMLLATSLHLHIILLRFTLLRPRVFGGQQAIANAL